MPDIDTAPLDVHDLTPGRVVASATPRDHCEPLVIAYPGLWKVMPVKILGRATGRYRIAATTDTSATRAGYFVLRGGDLDLLHRYRATLPLRPPAVHRHGVVPADGYPVPSMALNEHDLDEPLVELALVSSFAGLVDYDKRLEQVLARNADRSAAHRIRQTEREKVLALARRVRAALGVPEGQVPTYGPETVNLMLPPEIARDLLARLGHDDQGRGL